MNEQQAQELLSYVELDHKPGYARMQQLGSGPWVVIVGKGDYYLWSFADYTVYRQAEESKVAANEPQNIPNPIPQEVS